MSRWVILLAFLGFAAAGTEPSQAADRPPNIIVFMIDDLGWTDLGCYGSDLYETPNVDRLAADGIRFTDAYAACTVCSPTRAALMTGMYPARLNLTDWIDGTWAHMGAKRRSRLPLMPPAWTERLELHYTTIAEALRDAGYRTAHVGKWHLTPRSDDPAVVARYYPERQGFDINIAGNQWGAPGSYYWPYRRPRQKSDLAARVLNFPAPETTKGKYLTDMLADEAVRIIEQWHDRPFFLYFAHYAVHTPIQGRRDLVQKYRQKVTPQHKHRNATYAAMVESVDASVSKVRATLDRLGIAKDTVIIFTSDNGGLDLRNNPTDNAPLRAGKGSAYEGGVRVPTIIYWPGVTPAQAVCHEPIITCDFYPTLLDIAGTKGNPEHNADVDGVSLVGLLKDPGRHLSRQALYWHYPHYHPGGATPYSAVRAGPWRLVEFYEDGHVELYNLADDLGEKHDLARKMPDKTAELKAMLHRWRDKMQAQPPRRNPDFASKE